MIVGICQVIKMVGKVSILSSSMPHVYASCVVTRRVGHLGFLKERLTLEIFLFKDKSEKNPTYVSNISFIF